MTTEAASPRLCLNCGEPLHGRFCHACGQREQDQSLAIKHIFKDVIHDIWHFDAKVLQTVKLLVMKPGYLTVEYLAGRRARHVPPFRLYIFVSFVLFSLLAFGKGEEKTHREPARRGVVQLEKGPEESAATETGTMEGKSLPQPEVENSEIKVKLDGAPAWEKRIEHVAKDPDGFRRHFQHRISQAMFVLLPGFALLLTALYLRRRRYFVEHMVFSIHAHTFFFLVFILQWLLGHLPGAWGGGLGTLLMLAVPIHLGLALRRVYGQSTPKILVKGALLSASYLMVVGFVLLGALVLTAIEH